jgi:glycosyltransferase involved in cell wall biosynthesis
MSKLGIIIPTYNRSKLLTRCVQSVICEPGDFEVLIINDNSPDDTDDVVKSFEDYRIKYIKKAKNGGVNSARNLAFQNSDCEWMFCLDDDEEMLPGGVGIILKRLQEMPQNYNVAYFNSKIIKDQEAFTGGFHFEEDVEYYDPSYFDTMMKYGLKGDCKPAFRRSLFQNPKYLFPESVNGFESYTMNRVAKDKKGIRYFRDVVTLVHQESVLKDRLSINAPRKSPWPMFVLHFDLLVEHFWFYVTHVSYLYKKLKEMTKLFIRGLLGAFTFPSRN